MSIIGGNGTRHPVVRVPRDLQPELPPVRTTCPPGCACRTALETGDAIVPALSREQLVEWMSALAGPLHSSLGFKRMYHHERSTQPESPLNTGYVGIARGLAAFGVSPAHYRRLHDAARALPGHTLIGLFGGAQDAREVGFELTDRHGLLPRPALVWNEFCPLIWNEEGEAAERLLDASLTERK